MDKTILTDRLTIDLLDMLRRLLKKWLAVLLCAVLAAGIVFGYYACKGLKIKSSTETFLANCTLGEPYTIYSVAEKAQALLSGGAFDNSAFIKVEKAVDKYETYQNCIDELNEQIKKKILSGNVSVSGSSENDDYFPVAELKDADELITSFETKMTGLTKEFSSEEMDLFNVLLVYRAAAESGSPEALAALNRPTVSLVNKKMTVIGFVGGAFIACAWICLKYILSNKLRVAGDLKEAFGLYDAGTKDNIMAVAAKKGYNAICVLGAAKDNVGIDSADITIADAAVIAETIDVSRYEDIESEVVTCEQYGVPVIGYLVY